MLKGKFCVGERFLNDVLDLLEGLFQLRFPESLNDCLGFLSIGFLALLCMDSFQHLGYKLPLRTRNNREYIAVEGHNTTLVFGFRKHLSDSFQHPQTLSPTMR